MQKPISIDDMFSLVTREVRLVTKNAQRPYKYASLENIVCLTPTCSAAPSADTADIVQQARQSEDEELQIALQTRNSDALETYLQKYPETTKRAEILGKISALKRSDFSEWTLYEIGNQHSPQFMQIGSIQQIGDRAAAKTKFFTDPKLPMTFYGKSIPDAAYLEEIMVYDCTKPASAIADDSILDKSGKLLFHYKWGDPQYLNLAIGTKIGTHSVGSVARSIACHEELATPLVTKQQIADMKFSLLSSIASGDGELYYSPNQSDHEVQGQKEILFVAHFFEDHNIKDVLAQGSLCGSRSLTPMLT